MHIRTLGNTVQLCRWQVDYTRDQVQTTDHVPTEEEADALVTLYGGTKTRLETAADEWIDGIQVESLDRAREIAAMGEPAYKQWLAEHQAQTPESLMRENERLRRQVEALEQQAAFHENIFMELAEQVYA